MLTWRRSFEKAERHLGFTGLCSSWHFPSRFHRRFRIRRSIRIVSRRIGPFFSKSNLAITASGLHVSTDRGRVAQSLRGFSFCHCLQQMAKLFAIQRSCFGSSVLLKRLDSNLAPVPICLRSRLNQALPSLWCNASSATNCSSESVSSESISMMMNKAPRSCCQVHSVMQNPRWLFQVVREMQMMTFPGFALPHAQTVSSCASVPFKS